jgi:GNAT superfamily N-acetyltransferase
MSDRVVSIRDVSAGDEGAWRRYWADYQTFYEVSHPETLTATTWHRLLDPQSPVFGLVAEVDGRVVGIANCVMHASTWSIAPFCYLNDLYVDAEVRGASIGKALIDELVARGKEEGWGRVYWMTHQNNARARRLYDRYGPASGFISYVLKLQ